MKTISYSLLIALILYVITFLGIPFTANAGAFSFTADHNEKPFITTWLTTLANETVTIPTAPSDSEYDFTIDWGDGSDPETISGDDPNPSHTYADPGEYQIEITGTFPRIFLDGNEDYALHLQSIDQWGDIQWESMEGAFAVASIANPSVFDSVIPLGGLDALSYSDVVKMFEDKVT